MSDFEIDNLSGDLKIVNYDFILVTSADEITQRILITLRTYKGELFYNTDFGTPYYQSILGKNIDLDLVESSFKASIVGTPGVKKLLEFGLDYREITRELVVTFKAQIYDDSEIIINEVI